MEEFTKLVLVFTESVSTVITTVYYPFFILSILSMRFHYGKPEQMCGSFYLNLFFFCVSNVYSSFFFLAI